MLKEKLETLRKCNYKRLEHQCENEDISKEILLYAKDKSVEEQHERRKFLDKRIEQRKNLYIYPTGGRKNAI